MYKKIFIILFSLFSLASNDVPKQFISISGKVLNGVKTKFKVDYLDSFKNTNATVFDPYQKGLKCSFQGIMLEDFFKQFSKDSTKIKVVAINGYEVIIERSSPRVSSLMLAYKQDSKYIDVKMMGPLRIVRIGLGVISEEELILEGIDWVWMVKELVFE